MDVHLAPGASTAIFWHVLAGHDSRSTYQSMRCPGVKCHVQCWRWGQGWGRWGWEWEMG